jgi:hypothetical protein
MTETNASLENSARIMFATLNNVYQLHAITELETENDEMVEGCIHCSAIAEAIVHYPCPTVQLLLSDMVVEAPADEETPAE